MTGRVLLLAGSVGPERRPSRPDPDEASWYLPLHLRDAQAARERIATQVAAGADVVVAPTWRTHRRALLPLGETRRVGAWTAAAVRVAREAVEVGLERRAEAIAEADDDDPCHVRPVPLVAASLPALDDDPESTEGRLLPAEAATRRDYREQAGWLAASEPDIILVEGQRGEPAATSALTEAADTGLSTWVALTPDAVASVGPQVWLDRTVAAGVGRVLVPPPLERWLPLVGGPMPWGALMGSADGSRAWLEAGTGSLAIPDHATLAVLEPVRRVIDEFERPAIEAERATRLRWQTHLRRAAAMAPGGAAAWIGGAASEDRPPGFQWSLVAPDDLSRLPEGGFRLLVDPDHTVTPTLTRALEHGGVVVGQPGPAPGLRLLVLDDSAEPPLAVYRRED